MSNSTKPRLRAGYKGAVKFANCVSAIALIAPAVTKAIQAFRTPAPSEPEPKPAPAPQIAISDSEVQIVTSERHERPVIKWGPRRVNIPSASA